MHKMYIASGKIYTGWKLLYWMWFPTTFVRGKALDTETVMAAKES